MLPIQVRVNMGEITMKGYSTLQITRTGASQFDTVECHDKGSPFLWRWGGTLYSQHINPISVDMLQKHLLVKKKKNSWY